MLRRLLGHGAHVDVKDNDGREPLMWAASAGSTDAILTLVNAGAAVSARDKERTEIFRLRLFALIDKKPNQSRLH